MSTCHDLSKTAKSLFIFLFFFFFFWTYYTRRSAGKCHVTCVTATWIGSHRAMSHDKSHDGCGKTVHRSYSSCISSIENLIGTLLSSHQLRLGG